MPVTNFKKSFFRGRKHIDDYDGSRGFFVDSNYEKHFVENKYGKDSFAVKFLHFIHGHPFQIFLGLLLVIDVSVIITELVLEAHLPQCHVIEDQCECECYDHSHAVCDDGHEVEPHCHHHPEWVDKLHKGLLGTSIAILCVFEVELFAIFCVVRELFFHNFWYMLDVIIVSVSLAIEILFLIDYLSFEESEIGLLVFIRLWRFVRIGHGIYVDTHEFEHAKAEAMHEKIEKLEHELKMLKAGSSNVSEAGVELATKADDDTMTM